MILGKHRYRGEANILDLSLSISASFCAGLREEEVVKIDLYNLNLYISDTMNDKNTFVHIIIIYIN